MAEDRLQLCRKAEGLGDITLSLSFSIHEGLFALDDIVGVALHRVGREGQRAIIQFGKVEEELICSMAF